MNNVFVFRPRPKPPKPVCVICEKPYDGFGNNPDPVCHVDSGNCCDACNARVVLPMRYQREMA